MVIITETYSVLLFHSTVTFILHYSLTTHCIKSIMATLTVYRIKKRVAVVFLFSFND